MEVNGESPVSLAENPRHRAGRGDALLGWPAAAGAESEGALLAAIVACSSDAIVSLSLDGVITSWNAAAEKLFGYVAGEIVGHSIRTLVPPARERERTVRFERALRGSAPQEWETERLGADGTALPVSVTLSAIGDRSGAPIGVGLAAAAASGPTDLDELLDHLLDPVLADAPEDDIALLAIRRLAGSPVGPDTARHDKGEQVDWRPRHDASN